MTEARTPGLSLAPFRALRPVADGADLAHRLCPPYDVVDETERARLLAGDPDNAIAVILPRTESTADPYEEAAERLAGWVSAGQSATDPRPALYVYEMATSDGSVTRGLLGAVELRDPADGVILPHENTMAGPVADRLALMRATRTNLEPIYLVYDGGGAASDAVASADGLPPLAIATTPDGVTHRLWSITDPDVHRAVDDDLAHRRALIADGHHRYATYRELQRELRAAHGPGPWDRGLTLLVDSSGYGPQVHAIHRVLIGLPLAEALDRGVGSLRAIPADDPQAALAALDAIDGFAAVLTDGTDSVVVSELDPARLTAAHQPGDPEALAGLDVTVLHRVLVESVWGLEDTVDTVGYAHSVPEAIAAAQRVGGTAVLLRATPVGAVAAVAAQGGRMPRKSTLFTPKPASGLVMRRFADG